MLESDIDYISFKPFSANDLALQFIQKTEAKYELP